MSGDARATNTRTTRTRSSRNLEQRLSALLEGDDPRTLTGPRLAALRQLQQEEIELSLIDLKCQIQHTDDIFRQVEFEVFGQKVSG